MTNSVVVATPIVPSTVVVTGGNLTPIVQIQSQQPASVVIRQVEAGPAGAAGAQGVPGSGGDKNYTHDQMTSSVTWVVVHNLGKYPSVSVVDSAGSLWEGHVAYDSLNQLTLTFSAPFGGKAYLN